MYRPKIGGHTHCKLRGIKALTEQQKRGFDAILPRFSNKKPIKRQAIRGMDKIFRTPQYFYTQTVKIFFPCTSTHSECQFLTSEWSKMSK
jgi:hypothetical protein